MISLLRMIYIRKYIFDKKIWRNTIIKNLKKEKEKKREMEDPHPNFQNLNSSGEINRNTYVRTSNLLFGNNKLY